MIFVMARQDCQAHEAFGFVMPPDDQGRPQYFLPLNRWREDIDITAMTMAWAQEQAVENRAGEQAVFDPELFVETTRASHK